MRYFGSTSGAVRAGRTLLGLALGAAPLQCNHPPTGLVSTHLEAVPFPGVEGVPGWALADSVKVRVLTPGGRPQAGIRVFWSVRVGDGLVSQASDTSDPEGYASVRWTLGPLPGPNRLRAEAEDGDTLEFEVVGTAFRADRVTSSPYGIGCGLVATAWWCWGDGFWKTTPPASERVAFGWRNLGPGLVDDQHSYLELAAGLSIVCGLEEAGAVLCARATAHDQAPTQLTGLPPLYAFSLARMTTGAGCGLISADSTAWCWEAGETPAPVPGSQGLTAVQVGGLSGHLLACGLERDSTAVCWGEGPLGDGSLASSSTPMVVTGNHHYGQLVVGWGFACGRTAGSEAWCWGKDYEQFAALSTPLLVPTLALTGALHLATSEHRVQAQTATGFVRWYGAGFEHGSAPVGLSFPPPVRSSDALECALQVGNQVYCYDEMFDASSALLYESYSPTQPFRGGASPSVNTPTSSPEPAAFGG